MWYLWPKVGTNESRFRPCCLIFNKVLLLVLMCLSLLVPSVYAEHGKMKGGHGDFDQKFCQKAMMIVKNQEELGLSDAQVKKVKDLKMSTKKDLIRKKGQCFS